MTFFYGPAHHYGNHLSFWHNVKESQRLKFKIISITCRFHVSDVVLTLYISYKHLGEALLF